MLYPFTFHPIFKKRVWGGRNIERLFDKSLPKGEVIGESWEISDRPGDVSSISNGALVGKDLRWLMQNHRSELLGKASDQNGRFPLLIKILDAQDVLSLQVHPPEGQAAALGGEPKTEMWYVVDAAAGACLYAGLKSGCTRDEFETRLQDGTVAECIHRIPVEKGDSLFLPSGRVHAIAAGNVIFEVQQNSDTTYRVFDWNRTGLDGKPRELHVQQSLSSIAFNDYEPPLASRDWVGDGNSQCRILADDPLFHVEVRRLKAGGAFEFRAGQMAIVAQVDGCGRITSPPGNVDLTPGQFCLIPASVGEVRLNEVRPSCEFLVATAGIAG